MATVTAPVFEQSTSTRNVFEQQLYRKAVTVFYIEERMKVFARQGKCSFVASSRGHEITQVGITSLLKPGHDWFFSYYRSKGFLDAPILRVAARDSFVPSAPSLESLVLPSARELQNAIEQTLRF